MLAGILLVQPAATPARGLTAGPHVAARDIDAVAQQVHDYWLANRPGAEDNEWARAVYFSGSLAHYAENGHSRYLDQAWQWAETFRWQLHDGCTTVLADDQAAGQTYLALHALDPQRANLDCLLRSIEQSMAWGWIEIDLGAAVEIDRVTLDAYQERTYRYLVDGKQELSDPYTLLLDHTDLQPGATARPATQASTPVRYVRLRVIGAAGYSGPWVSLTEVRIYAGAAPDTNLALNRPVRCSSAPEPQNPCAQAVDGDPTTRWAASFPDNLALDSPNWWWVDALYMAGPVYARLAALEAQGVFSQTHGYGSVLFAKYDETRNQRGLYAESAGLWYRDTRFIEMRSPNGKPIFWSRGNGWGFAALARILDILPPSDPHYAAYLRTFQAMAAALVAVQEPAGYWNQNLADPDHCGGPESSGTAFFAYGLAWGINQGHLAQATYLPATIRAREWLVQTAVQSNPDGLLGYVQPIGDRPICDQSFPLPGPTDSADFGVGAFLLAAAELAQLPPLPALPIKVHLPFVQQ